MRNEKVLFKLKYLDSFSMVLIEKQICFRYGYESFFIIYVFNKNDRISAASIWRSLWMIQYTEIYFVLMYVYMNHETDGIDLERVVGFTLTNIFHFSNLSSLNKKSNKKWHTE